MKIKATFLSILCASGLAIAGLGSVGSRSSAAQQTNLCTQLAQDIGRLAYNAAFPLATYTGASCNSIDRRSSGTDYRFRVNGTGVWWGAPLWTDVIFSTDSAGRFQNIQWGDHNSPFWPPGQTFIVTAAAVGDFNEALQTSSATTTSTTTTSATPGSAGAVCIRNPTDHKLSYRYRWGSNSWKSHSIEAGRFSRHWWNYSAGSQTSPTLRIEFDNNMASGYTPSSYNLPRNIVSENFSCDEAREYAFSFQQNRIDIHTLAD